MSKCVCDAVGGLVLEYCYVREAACIAAACGSWSECMEAYKEAIGSSTLLCVDKVLKSKLELGYVGGVQHIFFIRVEVGIGNGCRHC